MPEHPPTSPRHRRPALLRRVALAVPAALLAAGCGSAATSPGAGGSGGPSGDSVTIGASLPLSGPLAGFGGFQKWGYQHAVDMVNQAGGLDVGGTKRPVRLTILDDKTDPNASSANIDTLISKDKVTALLGSCTPSLVIAGALIAERNKMPMVTGCAPLEAFKSVRSWKYVYDLFFDEPDLAQAPFSTLGDGAATTNKKVAILHDNGPDGEVVGGKLWPDVAGKSGYQVVVNESFPTDATQFSSLVDKAKAAGADVVLVDAVTPQAVSIRKQMASVGYTPKVLAMEKGAEPVQFAQALGKESDGVLVGGYWDPSLPYPGARDLAAAFESETKQTSSQHIADSFTAAQVLLEAISAAGSTDPQKITHAIGRTDKTYVVGPIKFDTAHTAKLAIAEQQWQSGTAKVVWPKASANAALLSPVPAS